MQTNIGRYRSDLKALLDQGQLLENAIQYECAPEEFTALLLKKLKGEAKVDEYIKGLPSFPREYQTWYSEALTVIKQLLPDRFADFRGLYECPKTSRKNISHENYTIEDYLHGLTVRRSTAFEEKTIVDPKSAISRFRQQLAILKAVEKRFTSTLFDIAQVVQADIFDNELDAARELLRKGFRTGAGAIAGVVLERHLKQVLANHSLSTGKKNNTITTLNDFLKGENVYDAITWRKIQLLGDIRNKCDHSKADSPTVQNISEIIEGTNEIIKTVY